MYQSKQQIYTETKQQLKIRIIKYISEKNIRRSQGVRRKVRLEKYISANDSRKDARIRYSAFFSGMEILQKSKDYTRKIIDGFVCYEFQGLAKNGEIVSVHLREEEFQKDKILFLISTFYKKKTSSL